MNNKQQYLDIAAGNGEKEASSMVAIPASELTLARLEQRLEEQNYFTDGEIDYIPESEGEFFFTCKQGEEELRFYISLVDSDPEYVINPYFSTIQSARSYMLRRVPRHKPLSLNAYFKISL